MIVLKRSLALCFLFLLIFLDRAWGRELPRRHELFELGASYADSTRDLVAFNCKDLGSQAYECVLMGYPRKDDFLVLRFYQGVLVSIAQFLSDANFDDVLKETVKRLGKPTTPEYRSDRAIAYIWNDKRTYITLSHLILPGYVVYEVRDAEAEPLLRKALGYKGK